MVAISSAVAGIDPVEPAATTGASLLREARRLRLDQRIAPRRGLDRSAFAQHRRPRLARDLQKFQRELPVGVEKVGDEAVEPSHDTSRMVMSSISRARSSASAQAAVGVCATSGMPLGAANRRRARPFGNEPRQQQPPFEAAERRRQIQRFRRKAAGGRFREGDLVLVDVADGDDARQDRRLGRKPIEKSVARQPAGAPRRQIERHGGERERIAQGGKAELAAGEASISVGRNGADGGILKTRGGIGSIGSSRDLWTFPGTRGGR